MFHLRQWAMHPARRSLTSMIARRALSSQGGDDIKMNNKFAICNDYLALKHCGYGSSCTRHHIIGGEAVRKRLSLMDQTCLHTSFCYSKTCRKLRKHRMTSTRPSGSSSTSADDGDQPGSSTSNKGNHHKHHQPHVPRFLPPTKEQLWEICIIVKEELNHLSNLYKGEETLKVDSYNCIFYGANKWLALNFPMIANAWKSSSTSSDPNEVISVESDDAPTVVNEFMQFFAQNLGISTFRISKADGQSSGNADDTASNDSSDTKDDHVDPWNKFLATNKIGNDKEWESKVLDASRAKRMISLDMVGLTLNGSFVVLDRILDEGKGIGPGNRVEVVLHTGLKLNRYAMPKQFTGAIGYLLLHRVNFLIGLDELDFPRAVWITIEGRGDKPSGE